MTIEINKPAKEANKSRFDGAKSFASGSTETSPAPAAEPPKKAQKAPAKSDIPLLRKKVKTEPTKIENFEMEESLIIETRQFLAQSRKFRYKRDFYIQCIKDGLKKYKDE